jgi:glycosyltransferase involved in cell wall biosynthesis
MPVRNEADFIVRSLGRVLDQDYQKDRLQVIVVDGASDDGTDDLVEQTFRAQESVGFAGLTLLRNPRGIVPVSLNLALGEAQGDVVIRVDGHCEIPVDYVIRCVRGLLETDADCYGGRLETVGTSTVAKAIARAQSSIFGVGGADFRTSDKSGYVDTLAFGAYRREVFQRIGDFDEELVRNQDDEFNFRLVQSGGRIWLDAALVSKYYSRADLKRLWRQYYEYGLYKVRVIQKRSGVASIRHLVPAAFVVGIAAAASLSAIVRDPLPLAIAALPYVIAMAIASLIAAKGAPRTFPILPLAFAILHFGYGTGFLAGLWRWRSSLGRMVTP